MKLGRNDPCHCGSGKKYKACCLAKDEAKQREARAKASAAAAPEEAKPEAAPEARRDARPRADQPWKGHANTRGFQRVNSFRKVGSS
jgi:hypothetical protein